MTANVRTTYRQLIRYGLIGVGTNALGYLVYLLVTSFGFDPKTTMTFFYFVGAAAGFFGNKKLSFAYEGNTYHAALRYALAHGIGYSANYLLLTIFVDWYGIPHQYVQAVAIVIVAGVTFVLFKMFVFPHQSPVATEAASQQNRDERTK